MAYDLPPVAPLEFPLTYVDAAHSEEWIAVLRQACVELGRATRVLLRAPRGFDMKHYPAFWAEVRYNLPPGLSIVPTNFRDAGASRFLVRAEAGATPVLKA